MLFFFGFGTRVLVSTRRSHLDDLLRSAEGEQLVNLLVAFKAHALPLGLGRSADALDVKVDGRLVPLSSVLIRTGVLVRLVEVGRRGLFRLLRGGKEGDIP